MRKEANKEVHVDPVSQITPQAALLEKLSTLEIHASLENIERLWKNIDYLKEEFSPLHFFTDFQQAPKTLQILITLSATGHRAFRTTIGGSRKEFEVIYTLFADIYSLLKKLTESHVDAIAIDKILSHEIQWACAYFPRKYRCSILPLYILDQKSNRTPHNTYSDYQIVEIIKETYPLFKRRHHKFDNDLWDISQNPHSPDRLEAKMILPCSPLSFEESGILIQRPECRERVGHLPLPSNEERIEAARERINNLITSTSDHMLATIAIRGNDEAMLQQLARRGDTETLSLIAANTKDSAMHCLILECIKHRPNPTILRHIAKQTSDIDILNKLMMLSNEAEKLLQQYTDPEKRSYEAVKTTLLKQRIQENPVFIAARAAMRDRASAAVSTAAGSFRVPADSSEFFDVTPAGAMLPAIPK